MAIGETLAQARQRAGLTVAQVSARTRIRETIIRGIEDDDYSACGGDFYARGHIRAIAKVVGTDSGPLIQEYDALHRAPGALSAVSLEELQATSAREALRHRADRHAWWALVAAACVSAWRRGNLPALWSPVVAGLASAWRKVNLPAVRGQLPSARAAWRRVNWTAVLGLVLVVVLGFGVYRLVSGPPRAAVAPPAASKHAATVRHALHTAPRPAPKASHRALAPAPAAAPAQTLTPAHAAAFGPGGGDNPQLAPQVISAHPAAGWHTDWYTTARFGNLYPGTGLLLTMGQTVTITRVQVNLGGAAGASFQLRVGAKPTLADMPAVAHAAGASGVVWLRLTRPAHGRYVLVWFTRLPARPGGTFQAAIDDISLQGRA